MKIIIKPQNTDSIVSIKINANSNSYQVRETLILALQMKGYSNSDIEKIFNLTPSNVLSEKANTIYEKIKDTL